MGKILSNERYNSGLELAYYWCLEIPLNTIVKLTGLGSHTVYDWMILYITYRELLLNKRKKMGGTNTIVQVDES